MLVSPINVHCWHSGFFEGGTVRGMTTRQARIALQARFGSRTKVPQTVLTTILSSRLENS